MLSVPSFGERHNLLFRQDRSPPIPAPDDKMKPQIAPLKCCISLCSLALLLSPSAVRAESPQWSRFHGVDGNGVVADGTIPPTWTDADYKWRRKLGARDVGSPIVHQGRVYYLVSKPDAQKIVLESIDLESGKVRWQKEFDQREYHLHKRNTFASSTPTADDDYVFASWADPQSTMLKCFDHDGNEIWSRDFGSWQSQHGFGTSPRIFGSMVLLFNSQQAEQLQPGEQAGQSRMIAVDRKSGATIWETPLQTTRSCYGVPAIYETGSTTQIIGANTGNGLFGLDAKTGKLLWNLTVFNMRSCSTPLVVGNIAIGSAGSGGGGNHLVAVRIPSAPGEQPTEVYRIERNAPYVPTPVLHEGRLYMVDDKGIASCVDATTGESIWMSRIGGNFGASPVLIGDTLLLISLDGKATLLRAGDRFEKIGEVDLGGAVGATPAFAEGHLLLRVDDELRCLGPKAI
jgi:outer membrane protein assembly factor BamB